MSRSAALERADGAVPRPLASARALELGLVLRTAFGLALGSTLALAPFEGQLLTVRTSLVTMTELELAMFASLAAWAGVLAVERRLPRVRLLVASALVGMIAVSVLSALSATTLGSDALRFTARSLAFWLLFLAAVDLVRTDRLAARLTVCILAGAVVSAAVGWVSFGLDSAAGLPGAGRLFTVGGAARVAGTFDYPNTAAMFWEVALLIGLPLLMRPARRAAVVAIAVGLTLVGGALLMTFSRGALVGALAGLAVVMGAGVVCRRRREAGLAFVTALALLAGALGLQVTSNLPLTRLISEADRGFYGATYGVPASIVVAPGAVTTVSVTLTNTGEAAWRPTGADAFNLAYHWLDPQSRAMIVENGARTPLPRVVASGQSVVVDAAVVGPDRAGEYLLAWDLVQEHVAWFSEKSVAAATSTVWVGVEPVPNTGQAPPTVDLYPDAVRVPTRAELWSAALTMIGSQPLLGVGPGTFRLRYGDVLGWPRWDDRIHSNDLYLELAATTGLLGLAAFLVLVAAALRPQLRVLLGRRDSKAASLHGADGAWALRAGLIAAIVAVLVHGVVDYFFAFTPTAVVFWSVLGIGLGVALGRVSSPADARAGASADAEAPA